MEYQIYTLPNGIRLVHKQVKNEVAHCGLIINTGTRDEKEDESGIAHFIEHVIFKGTKKRKAYHILNRIENVGGDLNAYTSKEETCIYASFLKNYYGRSLELFSDIILNSVFPVKEIEKEKDVVIDEINSYKDSPSEEIIDEFEEIIFHNHPLENNILGTPENVKKINRKKILNFIKRNYSGGRMVISSVGDISFTRLIKMAEKYFSDIPGNNNSFNRSIVKEYKSVYRSIDKSTYLTHCCMGNIAYQRTDSKRIPLILLNNVLGGPGMNSRLNLAIREKHGLTYTIESIYQPYSDTGIFAIYVGVDPDFLDKTIEQVKREMTKLKEKKLGVMQLHIAKRQLRGQHALAMESSLNEMFMMGKNILRINKVNNIQEIYRKIEVVTAEELMDVANEIFKSTMQSILIYNAKG
ncbi:MAG: insulinase family protein [Bacteroidales bacterium]|nr:insulinase family protein [Bacteroidales bacterium]